MNDIDPLACHLVRSAVPKGVRFLLGRHCGKTVAAVLY